MRLVLLALALAAALFLFLWWFLRTPPQKAARALRRSVLFLAGGTIILLAATGRLYWLYALLGALLPFVMRLLQLLRMLPLPLLQRLLAAVGLGQTGTGPASATGQKSRLDTRFLHMELDHDSGAMEGEVLEGLFKGRRLDTMTLDELRRLLDECRVDTQSAAVLEAYLDRVHPDWRDAEDSGAQDRQGSEAGSRMTEQEAREILGLQPGATREEIITAHRRLMQKLHPDRGGSDYLAAQINRAKDVLLDSTV